jgi:serine/threonine protein kinase
MLKKDSWCAYAFKVWSKKTIGTVLTGSPQNDDVWRFLPRIPKMPFLVDVKFSFQTPTDLYVATDFFGGGELFWHLQKEGRFDENRSRFYIAEIILALQHLHKHDIICIDLKPDNILFDATGHIKISHFGLTKGYKSLTKDNETNAFCGTSEYLAPEAILDPKNCINIVNSWTLGVLLFEMCCGWSPFYAEDTQQMHRNIAFGKVRFPRDILSTECRDFVKGLLNRNPSHRLGSNSGAEELKRHPWFAAIDWDALSKLLIAPPFIPRIKHTTDAFDEPSDFLSPDFVLSNFLSPEFALKAAALTAGYADSTPLSPSIQANFKGFTFVDEASMDAHNAYSALENLEDFSDIGPDLHRMNGIMECGGNERNMDNTHFDI